MARSRSSSSSWRCIKSGLLFEATRTSRTRIHRLRLPHVVRYTMMDELACFTPGMIALGASGYGPEDSRKFLSLAEELAWTCYNF
ncbi:uncharacterized protein LOC130762938 isoform X2 [Actinidia eriantha]|uniref:uncharacterized protein LOC130762938 isoform X2 n=1 Tax=Actinidia eriantha TaxID=165200 RepID=UPI00258FFDD5|nr:uncharacterized protein LOC130762938 isoform X2 [Actinidia eriantha]XP_057474808.1 uncharacterized protein LOC130762938 isoform X2 [Actinidia eriantha]